MNAYVTLCNTIDYLPGVLSLRNQLINFRSKYELYIMCTKDIESYINTHYSYLSDNLIVIEHYEPTNTEYFSKEWNNTYDKLCIFDLVQFDNIIYLDADLQLFHNIDELFNVCTTNSLYVVGSQMSDWKFYHDEYKIDDINSGFMMFKPELNLRDKILKSIISSDNGDQPVINRYYRYNSDRGVVQLPSVFNQYSHYVAWYYTKFGILPTIIHWVDKKPWMMTKDKFYNMYPYFNQLPLEIQNSIEAYRSDTNSNYKEILNLGG